MRNRTPITAEMIARLETEEALERLEYERSLEPADSRIPTIPSPPPVTLEEAIENAPDSARLFMLSDVAPKVLH